MTRTSLAFLLIFTAIRAHAAIPNPVQVTPGHASPPLQSGVSIGGQAGGEFTLIGVHTEPLKDAAERLALVYGDRNGNQQQGGPGYFHVAVDRDGRRVVIDLAQLRRVSVDPQRLTRILMNSKLIESSDMTTDPFDGSTNITLNMRAPVRVRVASETDKSARLILDLEPTASLGKGKSF